MAVKASMRRSRKAALLERESVVQLNQLLDCRIDFHLMLEPLQMVLIRTYYRPKVLLTRTSLIQVASIHLHLIQTAPLSWSVEQAKQVATIQKGCLKKVTMLALNSRTHYLEEQEAF